MLKVMVADIFGITYSLKALAASVGGHVEIIDPYYGEELTFDGETEAYAFFMGNVGLERYCKIVDRHLTSISQQTEVIGFSVGASAIWLLSETINSAIFQRLVCFYGSQIRHHQYINPCVPTELVLPISEPTFDVGLVSENLSTKSKVKIHRTQYLHGFMNNHSKNFDPSGYEDYINWLRGSASQPVSQGHREER
jgi:dienelactone hydrolase